MIKILAKLTFFFVFIENKNHLLNIDYQPIKIFA